MRAASVTLILALTGTLALPALADAQTGPPPARSNTPPSNAPRRDCFWSREISGFSAPDDHTVYVRVGVRDIYRLDLMGTCLNVDWTQAIGVKTTAGSDFICQGLDVELIVPDRGIGPQHCPVSAVRKLTPAEVAALPRRSRP